MKLHSVEVKRFEQQRMGFGYNWFALVLLNGHAYTMIRQGNLGLWAFIDRSQLSREDQRYLDDVVNEELRRHKEAQ